MDTIICIVDHFHQTTIKVMYCSSHRETIRGREREREEMKMNKYISTAQELGEAVSSGDSKKKKRALEGAFAFYQL